MDPHNFPELRKESWECREKFIGQCTGEKRRGWEDRALEVGKGFPLSLQLSTDQTLCEKTTWHWGKRNKCFDTLSCLQEVDLTVEKPGDTISIKWLKLTSSVIIHIDIIYPQCDALRRALLLCGIIFKNLWHKRNHEKTSDKTKVHDYYSSEVSRSWRIRKD